LSSHEQLTVVDYGVEPTDVEPVQQTLAAGRTETKTVSDICRNTSRSPLWGRLLFRLVREAQPSNCLELGTSVGISTAYQAAALQLNGAGAITSLEGAEAVVEVARRNLDDLGLTRAQIVPGRFDDTLESVLASNASIDYAFIDGHHEKNATLSYFEEISSSSDDGAILLFDDIAWSRGMRSAWSTIRSDSRVRLSVDLFKIGLCVLGQRRDRRHDFRIALD
jgi:predicted O-methyltransferase YrrM